MMLDWQTEKKTLTLLRLILLAVINSDIFLMMLLEMSGLQAKISFV